jgi:hypothetical protein
MLGSGSHYLEFMGECLIVSAPLPRDLSVGKLLRSTWHRVQSPLSFMTRSSVFTIVQARDALQSSVIDHFAKVSAARRARGTWWNAI